MQERIEPPILISRLMTFVMATALVVLGVLVFTLDKMFPLERPQVFFLDTQRMEDKELILTKISDAISENDMDKYKKQFIQEYVRTRNEIIPDLAAMRAKWANEYTAPIRAQSTNNIYGQFVETDMAHVVLSDSDLDEPFNIQCNVDFPKNNPVIAKAGTTDTYIVNFMYTCFYGPMSDQQYTRHYSLSVKLQPTNKNAVKWSARMQNPLGLQVSEYETVSKEQDDPLNWTSAIGG